MLLVTKLLDCPAIWLVKDVVGYKAVGSRMDGWLPRNLIRKRLLEAGYIINWLIRKLACVMCLETQFRIRQVGILSSRFQKNKSLSFFFLSRHFPFKAACSFGKLIVLYLLLQQYFDEQPLLLQTNLWWLKAFVVAKFGIVKHTVYQILYHIV